MNRQQKVEVTSNGVALEEPSIEHLISSSLEEPSIEHLKL